MKVRFGAALGVAALAMSGQALAADSFTVSVTPTSAGTSQQPAAEQVTTDLRIDTDVTGVPHDAVTTYASLMPAEFADSTAGFATCDRKKIHAAATGGPHDPPDCPADSVLGSGVLESVVPELKISATTDKLVIYNDGGGQVTAWFHISRPTELTYAADAALSRSTSPFGPVVTWDFSPAANGQVGGVKVYVKRFQTTWAPRAAAPSAPGPAATPTTGTRKKKLAACIKRAKKRYRKGSRKRARAIATCRRRYRRSAAKARAAQSQDAQTSPFESTGCATGTWSFEAQVKFKDGAPDDKLDQSVPCAPAGGAPGAGGTGGGGTGGGCGLPICPGIR